MDRLSPHLLNPIWKHGKKSLASYAIAPKVFFLTDSIGVMALADMVGVIFFFDTFDKPLKSQTSMPICRINKVALKLLLTPFFSL